MTKHLFVVSLISALVLSTGNIHAQEAGPLIVHFAFDSDTLSAAAKAEIDSFLRIVQPGGDMNGHPDDSVVLSGYTDSIGAFGYNERLSVRRAGAVRSYVLDRGLAPAGRIKTAGYGMRYPVTGNGSDSGRAANRRVEIFFHRGGVHIVTGLPEVQRRSINEVVRDSMPAVAAEGAVVPGQKEAPVVATRDSAVVPGPPKRSLYDVVMDSSVAVGSTIPLRDVNFYPGRHIPLPSAARILDELARAMKANHRLRISIEGHICCLPEGIDGADLETMQPNLSVQRAKYVYEYLARFGIGKRRMSYMGFGASGKLYPREENEMERAENRRVEIRILAR